jgi:DNA (cytosine-5)-methyltransferase 1
MSRGMNYLSLFSGIGGFDLAFNRAGMKCVGMCEIDKNCQDILHRHFEFVHIYDDVKEINGSDFEKGAIDLICGGFPCQDLSVAGKRAGLTGERSGLWFEFARVIDELEPRWVVIENVPGLLSSNKGKDFAVIVQWLAERGYGVSWRVLDAQYFGVAQRRRRVFIVASLGNGRCTEVLFEREGMSGDTPQSRKAGEEIAGTVTDRVGGSGSGWARWNEEQGLVSTTLQAHHRRDNADETFAIAYNIQHNDGGEHKRKDRPNGGLYVNETEQALTVGTTDLTAICMSSGQANAEIVKDGAPSLTGLHEQPIVAWEMQHASEAYRESGEVAPTLQQRMGTGGNNIPLVGVRRLTPIECERLQGFPDGWTDGQADSTRYRQLGNAVAVPVVEWIGKRITKCLGA